MTKSFAGVPALRGVDLQILPGEVHCILGQNGAGKSTLIKTLAGVHRPDDGEISWRGEPVEIPTPEAALELGIATMYQELDVVDGLTIAENIFLGHEHSNGGLLKVAHANKLTKQLLTRLGHGDIPASTEVGQLSAANKALEQVGFLLVAAGLRRCVEDPEASATDGYELADIQRLFLKLA